jgi:hypothetical protein
MSLYPEDQPDPGPTVEQINNKFNSLPEQLAQSSQNSSQASSSKILTPEEEEKQNQRKKALLQELIQEEVQKVLEPINLQIQQIPNIINQAVSQNQNPLTGPGPNPAEALAGMPPEAKAAALAPIMTGLAQILQAWRGSQTPTESADPFGQMFKQLGLNIMQAGMDGIYQQIYPNFIPQSPPSNPLANRGPAAPGPGPAAPGESTGFR